MKRDLWITIAALALAAVTAIPLMAQPPQGRGPGGLRGMGPGGPGPGGPGAMPMLRGLDLSDAQREQIRTITEAERSTGRQSKVGELQKELQLAILADTPDASKIDALKGAIGAATVEALAARIEIESRIAQVLTPEQRAQARDTLAQLGPPNGPPPGGRRGRGRL